MTDQPKPGREGPPGILAIIVLTVLTLAGLIWQAVSIWDQVSGLR